MSADNGIYVLKTDGPEWRVAECQAIDNVFYENPDGNDDVLLSYFGNSPVFTKSLNAGKFAILLYDELMCDDIPICEHGIIHMKLHRPFPKPNNDNLVLIEQPYDEDDPIIVHSNGIDCMIIDRRSMELQGLEKEKVEILIERGIITPKEGEDLIRLWEMED